MTTTSFSSVATSRSYNDLINRPTIPAKLSDFTDVSTSGATSGQVLSFDGSSWTPSTIPGSSTSSIWTKNVNDIYYNNGNIGIGTTSPLYKLTIEGTSVSPNDAYSRVFISLKNKSIDKGSATIIDITAGNSGNNTGLQHLASSYTGVPNMQDFGQLYSMGSGLTLSAGSNTGIMKFTVGNTGSEWIERMRINTSGNVGINTTQPTSKLQVVGLPEYSDNTTAKAGGLTIGAFYHTAGVLKVVY